MSHLIYITIDIRWVILNAGWCVNKKILLSKEHLPAMKRVCHEGGVSDGSENQMMPITVLWEP
jgi:hypothetical protein